jgi:steroid delta-isomerase-like uncharacterized protein
MSVEGNKRLMHRFFEAINKGNNAVWDELCAPGYVYHHNMGDMTIEQSKQYITSMLAAFPDLNGSIDDMIAEGDKVAARYTMRGTHKGAFRGIAPTGKRITITGLEIDRVAGGKFVETWGCSDTLGLMAQLEVAPNIPR